MAVRTAAVRPPSRLATGFGVFAECLLTGVWIALAPPHLVKMPSFSFSAAIRSSPSW
ncbi:hypothetical protein [Streptomyces zhihengii]